jgi:imidazolonepropionase-like amidohydrolase
MTHTDRLVRNCTIIDCVASLPMSAAAIWIRDGRIQQCGPEGEVRRVAPAEIDEIDLAGAYVMPGLVNMHTHFSLALPGTSGDRTRALGPHALALYMAAGARATLRSGVTAVRCVAERDHADFALRDAIAAGQVEGPRIFTAGQGLVCTGGHGHEGGDTLECDGADGFRRGVRTQIKAGADLIKVMISGGIAGQYEAIDTRQVTRDEMAAVIETAHDWGRKVTAHAGPAPVIDEAVRLGLDCVEHGYQLTEPVVKLMAERGTHFVPTLVVTRCGEFFDELGVPSWMQQRSLDAGPRHEQSYRLALAAGVPVMLGSDMPPFWHFEGTSATVRELEYMAGFGLSPLAALRAATVIPARWLGADDEFGTVQPGRLADLIAMDEDPSRDVSALRTLRWVMKEGQVVRDDR